MKIALRLCLGVVSLALSAAGAEAPRLTWQVSPDGRSLAVGWHDPTGIRAVMESTTDFMTWREVQRCFDTQVTSFGFRLPIHVGARPWWAPDRPVEVMQAFRVRRWNPPREGQISFGNRIIAAGVNAPVTADFYLRPGAPDGGQRPVGPEFLAQLLVRVPGVYVGVVGQPVRFRSGSLAGSIPAQIVTVPMDGRTDEIEVAMGAWRADLAPTYFEAIGRGMGYTGESLYLTIRPSTYFGPIPPPPGTAPPPAMVGLTPFSIAAPLGGGPP